MRIDQEGHLKQILSVNIHSDNLQTFLPLTQIYSPLVRSRIICAEMEAFIFWDEQEKKCYYLIFCIENCTWNVLESWKTFLFHSTQVVVGPFCLLTELRQEPVPLTSILISLMPMSLHFGNDP